MTSVPSIHPMRSIYQSLQMDIADIPPHDMTGDFVVLSERRKAEENASKQLQVKTCTGIIPS